MTPYEKRLAVMVAAIMEHSHSVEYSYIDKAEDLAKHLLHAVDTIPEKLQ